MMCLDHYLTAHYDARRAPQDVDFHAARHKAREDLLAAFKLMLDPDNASDPF